MLFRPLAAPLPLSLQQVGVDSLTALEGLTGYDQLEITCRQLVGLLRAYRATFAGSPERREDFNIVCEGLLEWLVEEIAPLRFTRSN